MMLVSPTATLPKASLVVESVVGVTPVPVIATDNDCAGFVVTIDTDPAGVAPRTVGVNVTAIVHVVAPASVDPHVVEGSIAYPPAGAVIEVIPSVSGAS